MRKVIGAVFQSLDGVMQAPGGPGEDPTGGFALGGWQMAYRDEVAGAAIGTFLEPPFALLLGRRTYDIFAGYWPYVQGEAAALGDVFTNADKYVLTRGDLPLEWANSHRLADMDTLAAIKAGDGPDLRIWGSSTLYPALLAAGLIDRLTTFTFPLVLGAGKRIFGAGTEPRAMHLTEDQVGPSGVVIATYEPAGAVRQASANIAPSNPREEDRQRRIAEGIW